MPAKPAAALPIASRVERAAASIQGRGAAHDLALREEIEALARFIHAARSEIAALRPDDIRNKHLPAATDELDAIVGATEEATGTILDSVEQIEAVAGGLGGDAAAKVGELVTRIYEACNFQDITGQRITKVVKTLKHIEARIDCLASAFGRDGVTAAIAAPAEPEATGEAALLNGPQLPGAAKSQADIDALFGKA